MKILSNGKFESFNENLFVQAQRISFHSGEKVNINKNGKYIVPGFIDQHIHGAMNHDVMDENPESIKKIADALVREGTTSFLATTMTCSVEDIKRSLLRISKYKNYSGGAKIAGAHLEGPFINNDYIGAQNPEFLLKPNCELIRELNIDSVIKLVTYAPEFDVDGEFQKALNDMNIVGSVGHSNATCSQTLVAVENGLKSVTHFHNAQSPHHHRNPGVVTAGLMSDDLNVELIVDKIHLDEDVVRMVHKTKPNNMITLITDSMCAKGMPDGQYELGGQIVNKVGNEARLENGALAGSVLRLIDGVKNYVDITDCQLSSAINLVTINQAKLLGLQDIGEIKEGYFFDIVVLDEKLNVIQTFVNGEEKYNEQGA